MKFDDGASFYDSSLLPHSRDDIVFALLLGLKFVPDKREAIREALAALARYQEDVGPRPISPALLKPENLMSMLKDAASGKRKADEAEQMISTASESRKNDKIAALEKKFEKDRADYWSMADRVKT